MAPSSLAVAFPHPDSDVQSANHPAAFALQSADHPQEAHVVTAEKLADMVRERDVRILQGYGGIGGLADHLGTSLESGMLDDSLQIQKRRQEFGANTYPGLSPKGFFRCLLHTCKVRAFFFIILWAVHSFPSGVKSYGAYEVPAMAVLVFLSGLVIAYANYIKQGLQFVRNKNEEMQNILVNVVRGGRRMQIPISGLVVGDITFLEAGDQVPADGLLVETCILCVDVSTMTGESGLIHVNEEWPFLLSGCKVIQGSGKMLVTGVGIKTEQGWSMVDLQEEAREEKPRQVGVNSFTAFVNCIRFSGATLGLFVSDFVAHREDSNYSGRVEAALLVVNVAALLFNFMAAIFVGDVGLSAVQLLWVNLIMDMVGVLAFATEHPMVVGFCNWPVALIAKCTAIVKQSLLQCKGGTNMQVN